MNIKDMKIIYKENKEFPEKLCQLNNCPKQLYALGNTKLLNDFSIAIIGGRICSDESQKFTMKLSFDLSRNGVNIVSGLAIGIDQKAHEGCLKARGKTIAVLGSGFENIYPKENNRLLDDILNNEGLAITEYAPDMPPFRQNFVSRNRIVAALVEGVVVIEAREKSGSLSTVRQAERLNKDIFVLPGNSWSESYKGSNALLVGGAKCFLNYKDILMKYGKEMKKFADEETYDIDNSEKFFGVYKEIYMKLKFKPYNINVLAKELGYPIMEINSKLTLMEIERQCKTIAGENFYAELVLILCIAPQMYL